MRAKAKAENPSKAPENVLENTPSGPSYSTLKFDTLKQTARQVFKNTVDFRGF